MTRSSRLLGLCSVVLSLGCSAAPARPNILFIMADDHAAHAISAYCSHHNTRAHYGVRTETHKLIHFWKKDQWECYDLVRDPLELKNIYPAADAQPIVKELKTQLARLKQELGDTDQFAQTLPRDTVDRRPTQLDRKHPDSPL